MSGWKSRMSAVCWRLPEEANMDNFHLTDAEADACMVAADVINRHLTLYVESCVHMEIEPDTRWLVQRMETVESLRGLVLACVVNEGE